MLTSESETDWEAPTTESVEERNKNIIRRVFDEFVNQGDFSVVDEIYGEDMVDHQPLPGAPEGLEGVRYTIAGLREGFPDLHVTIEDISANADHVVIHNTWRGTHRGDFLGLPPTGNRIEFRGVVVWRLHDGSIRERWGIGVESNMLEVLGMRRLAPTARATGKQRARSALQAATTLLSLPAGHEAAERELHALVAGPRRREYEASRKRVGIAVESFWTQTTAAGDTVVVHSVEARDPVRAAERLLRSDEPFDVWFRDRATAVYGLDPWAELAAGHTAARTHGWQSITGEITTAPNPAPTATRDAS